MSFSFPGQAIITKYHGATARKPARIVATTHNQDPITITLHNDGVSLSPVQASQQAVCQLADRLGWGGVWQSGDITGGRAWVCVKARRKAAAKL